jgi:hypothetical protein
MPGVAVVAARAVSLADPACELAVEAVVEVEAA